jgi:hypothetical protein
VKGRFQILRTDGGLIFPGGEIALGTAAWLESCSGELNEKEATGGPGTAVFAAIRGASGSKAADATVCRSQVPDLSVLEFPWCRWHGGTFREFADPADGHPSAAHRITHCSSEKNSNTAMATMSLAQNIGNVPTKSVT